jgi:hypothetical protein
MPKNQIPFAGALAANNSIESCFFTHEAAETCIQGNFLHEIVSADETLANENLKEIAESREKAGPRLLARFLHLR